MKAKATKKRKATKKPAPLPTTIVLHGSRQRELTEDEIGLLKRTVAKGTSDDEFQLFLWVARKHKLDPFTRQIHCVIRQVSKHHQDEKGIWVSGNQMTIQMGIDGYRSLAGRDHKDFGGCDEPEFLMMKEKTGTGAGIPEKASIRLWKKGHEHPIVGVAYWEEYAPKDLTAPQCFMWQKMPRHMLAKCAEALAIRKGYPELSDIYTDEEMHQADQDFTPGGRQIIEADGSRPSGAMVYHGGSQEAANAVAQRKIAEHAAHQHAKDTSGNAQSVRPVHATLLHSKSNVSRSASKSELDTKGKTEQPMQQVNIRTQENATALPSSSMEERSSIRQNSRETVFLTAWKQGLVALSGPGLSILRSEMTPDDRAFFAIKNDGGVFCLEEKLIFKFQDLCTRLNVAYVWSEPAKPIQPKAEKSTLPKAVIPPKDWDFGEQPAPAKSTDPILFEAKEIQKAGKRPFMSVNWNGGKHSCFDKGLWPILLAAIGKPVMLETKAKGQWSNLVRIVRVDGIEFGGMQ